MNDDKNSDLRYYIAHLVRIWTALDIIRKGPSSEPIQTFKDVCSDKLRNMLYEFANKKRWELGFDSNGPSNHRKLYKRLKDANRWFEGYERGPHSRNVSGAHFQPLSEAEHMFQIFGYGGNREWKQLTKGVASCVAMMKCIDDKPYSAFWRRVRAKVRGQVDDRVEVPIAVEALIQKYRPT